MSLTIEHAKEKYPNVYYEMIQNGYGYQFIYPIKIKGYDPPIGLFVVNLDQLRTRDLIKTNPLTKVDFEDYIFQQAKRVELIFNAQYTRLNSRQ